MDKKWMDEKNWFHKPSNREAIEQKKITMLCLSLTNNHSFKTRFDTPEQAITFNTICEDVDCCAYLLSRYCYQHEKLEKLSAISKHFSDINSAKYILSHGVIDQLQEVIFKKHPQFHHDAHLAFNVLDHNSRSARYFQALFKDYTFIKQCLSKQIFCYEFLENFPKDKFITQRMLKGRYYPQNNMAHLYNDEVMGDKVFILPILLEGNGYFLYEHLPTELKRDLELCDALKAKHPHVSVEVSSINTVEKFIACMDNEASFSRETYTLLDNMRKAEFIMNDSMAIAQVLEAMGEHHCECIVDLMGDPQFDSHPVQEFLKQCAQKHSDIKKFLQTPEGQSVMRFKVKSYYKFTDFESHVFPNLGRNLRTYLHANKLDKLLSKKEKSTHKNKI